MRLNEDEKAELRLFADTDALSALKSLLEILTAECRRELLEAPIDNTEKVMHLKRRHFYYAEAYTKLLSELTRLKRE
jgi:hypothetical protein